MAGENINVCLFEYFIQGAGPFCYTYKSSFARLEMLIKYQNFQTILGKL